MMIDYVVLKVIWWVLIASLFILFFIFGGRDFGVCILLPWVAKSDENRRLLINSIGGTWEGNQVWFVTAGAATFAAWPIVYATAFSGLYYALFIVLLSLILRPPGIDFRSKLENKSWRTMWDYALFVSGFVPTLIFGVGLGNLFIGLPFHFDESMRSYYQGSFWQLLTPLTVSFGLAAIILLAFHGGLFLQAKIGASVLSSIKRINMILGSLFIALFIVLGGWASSLLGFQISAIADVNTALLPLHKTVMLVPQGWLNNYIAYPALWVLPILTVLSMLMALWMATCDYPKVAMTFSSVVITTAIGTVGAALFPFILPSTVLPNHSVTVWDAVSSHRTLLYMFLAAVFFLPIVLGYTFWVFRVLRGQLTSQDIMGKSESY